VEVLASGFTFTEAPIALPGGAVAFSDVLGGGVHRWSPDGSVETVVERRRGIGGMALNADGALVVSGRDLSCADAGELRTVFAREGVTGFNDLCTDPHGRVYVGALHFYPFEGEAPVPGAIWAVGGDLPEPIELTREVDWPNGMGFSPAGDTLYASDYAHGHVLAWEVAPDGRLSGRRVFAQAPAGSCDGLAVDAEGAVLVALGEGGIGRFAPDGGLDRVIEVPAGFVSSLCFGGDDMCDLFVTGTAGSGTLFRTRADVPGLPVPAAGF
jgi:sugar lactone lactonase YvrE